MYLFVQCFAWVSCLPFELTACLVILFRYLGISFLSGIGVFVLSILTSLVLAGLTAILQRAYMKKQDARVSLTTEGLNNMKMLKLYSWVDVFTEMIGKIRLEELALLKKRMYVGIATVSSFTFFPALLQATAFTAFIGTGNQLDIDTTFAILTIFNIINLPLRILPMFIGHAIEFHVSITRMQRFLLLEERNLSVIQTNALAPESVEIRHKSNFLWGLQK